MKAKTKTVHFLGLILTGDLKRSCDCLRLVTRK